MLSKARSKALKITVIYLIISIIWIYFSDRLLQYLINDNLLLSEIQTYKGLFFVFITSFLLYYLIQSSFLELIKSKKKIERALKENQVLLSELHHRVKNNLAVICGLIDLQISKLDESGARILKETQYRIYTLADIEELLYQHGDMSNIPFHEYVEQLLSSFKETHEKLPVKTQVHETYLTINQAVPLGLLLNEIFTPLRINKKLKNKNIEVYLSCNKQQEVSLKLIFDESHSSILLPLARKENLEGILLGVHLKQLDSVSKWTQTNGSVIFSCTFKKDEVQNANFLT